MNIQKDYRSRLDGLIHDGYRIKFESCLLDGTRYIKLIHANGNCVTLMRSPGRLRQYTNGALVYDTMC